MVELKKTGDGSGSKVAGSTIIEAAGLVKVFSDFWLRAKARAVNNVSFDIRSNEIFGLLGPNGSGKSTIIKMILGLLHKTKGHLTVFGQAPSDVAIKNRIGYLPEDSYMYRFLNPRETLDYYAKLFGIDSRTRKSRIDELLEMVGLTQVMHRPVGEFSKGMTRRLGLAQSLINDPELLILDEPTSGLDPIGTRQVKDLLLELGSRGKTILLSSHLLSDVEDVCDRMVILYGGQIRAQGTSEELLRDGTHTVIKTSRLDQDVISSIDSMLIKQSGSGIESVDVPRQRLEDLFVNIVEEARREQVETSGAQHGGQTANFLKDTDEGEDLIDSLTRETDEQEFAPAATPEPQAREEGPAEDVLDALVNEDQPAESTSREPVAGPEDVDSGLIEGLMGEQPPDDQEERK